MRMKMVIAAGAISGLIQAGTGAQLRYEEPPAPIPQILDADPIPIVSVSPDATWLLLQERAPMPRISEVSQPVLGLAGTRINPRTNAPAFSQVFKGLKLRSLIAAGAAAKTDAAERRINVPAPARIENPLWSPDSRHVSFTVAGDDGVQLWVASVATGQVRQLAPVALNSAVSRVPCAWLPSGAALVCRTVPSGRGAAPSAPRVPQGPVIQEAAGGGAAVWTYQDLLGSATDEALFDHYFSAQIAIIGLDGRVSPVGPPGIHTVALPSPNSQFLLVQTVHRPYSYITTLQGFPTRTAIWDNTGRVVREIADTPLQEIALTGRDVVLTGPRSVSWHADAPATLVWAEATDGGNPDKQSQTRDRVLALAAPFSGNPDTLANLAYRFAGVQWVRSDVALITENWWTTRWTRTWMVDPAGGTPRKLFDRSSQDRYRNPGVFATRIRDRGTTVVRTSADGGWAYLAGTGSSPKGDIPFLDRISLTTGKTERLWRAADGSYETVVAVLDAAANRLLTQRESPTEPPNFYLRDRSTGTTTALTTFTDPAPQLAGITPQLLTYKRADGVQLSATMYLPPGYDKRQGPLPFLFWAYPTEFKDAANAAQVKGSPNRFARPVDLGRDHLFALTQGYGVLDDPSMPIIGEGATQPNDTYVQQLVASAKAAVDVVVDMGVADRSRIAVGGHSYGSFMTANLLIHSDLFRTGIARSGAFNRSLTPFGFQNESRTFWQARDTYIAMSPFAWADKLNEPILIIHGQMDSNPGTFPVQSERMFAAVKGNGGRARYVQLPYEDHGYRARESVGHVIWETMRWLDQHVKKAHVRTAAVQ